ncbi:MAG: TetR/AcrR family transcriptional regulator [Deltaproteobacteria bacterium]|nr:TetR/AcrR family transcriptional regulator [Deltaproteobacteria bacterium]
MGARKRREKEREKRKRTIIKAARKLFFDKGYKRVNVASIAKKADLSKGAIYLYFTSKEDIYAHILLMDIERFKAEVSDLFDDTISAADNLKSFTTKYIDFFLQNRELFRILTNFMMHTGDLNFSADINKNLIRETNEIMTIIDGIVQHGIKRGEFNAQWNQRAVRNILWALLNGIISLYLFVGDEAKREERIRHHVREGLRLTLEGLQQVH